MDEQKKNSGYDHVIPDIADWPIYKLSQDRRHFIAEINTFTLERLMQQPTGKLTDMLSKAIYQERARMKEEPWKVDPPNEKQFWRKIRGQLLGQSLDRSEEEARATNEEILRKIIHRYAEEIVGTFQIKTFLFARRFLTLFFTRLLNTAASRNWRRFFGSRHRLVDRLLVEGQVEAVRELMKKGTVIMVPTHFSNLDSILIGYALDSFAGLPSFSYGAGLNLYNTGYTAYFMNRLGAYRVDRRKKNTIYLETLKAMSNLSIQRGVNSLFFPGGTRSRSGALETKLKLGLLSTAVEAQRGIYEQGRTEKVFICPLILSYHFVLEGQFLIEQHLKRMGRERYIKSKDEFYSLRKLAKFAWQFFSEENDITLSFGQPMDVVGNYVDAQGRSFDQYGNEIDLREYFYSSGRVAKDLQRESEYTKQLGDRIVDRYFRDNIVLTSHLIAFAAFQVLKNNFKRLDLYGLLRLPAEDYIFPIGTIKDVVAQLRDELRQRAAAGKIKMSEQLSWDLDKLIADGVNRLGTYHVDKPLRYNKEGQIISESFKVLYFYHNRLDGYGLEHTIQWKKEYALQLV
ncbi:1-acyl-sn-glycerol-3-phosphate acyltransferase [Phaeodactylibacter luteus]|uniref:Glycerol-3-phosphate acyltransferase n=1 Tax=Phaeodactylibacter luteus TaxID=1564516 RepID=A0A5C6RKC5_9BACT|nr:1-acyl-sn-glycerol-3-phosphate acyltransferase [Phaeodactylibacter luteus]TXB61812.1 glycerol acyltransferase [Phaeodactylibacter luteus]